MIFLHKHEIFFFEFGTPPYEKIPNLEIFFLIHSWKYIFFYFEF